MKTLLVQLLQSFEDVRFLANCLFSLIAQIKSMLIRQFFEKALSCWQNEYLELGIETLIKKKITAALELVLCSKQDFTRIKMR